MSIILIAPASQGDSIQIRGASTTAVLLAEAPIDGEQYVRKDAGWEEINLASATTVVADEGALLADKVAGNMHVYDKYVITLDREDTDNVEIQIKFESPDNNFFYEKISNLGVIEILKVV